MKTILHFTAALGVLTLCPLPCPAQTAEASTPAPASKPVNGSDTLQTRTFRVPRDFLSKGSAPADPFAPSVKPDAKTVLTQLGIEFTAPGSGASFNSKSSIVTMTNTPEQLDSLETMLSLGKETPLQGRVNLEVFSLPPLAARKALLAHPKESELYAWLDAELAKPDSTVKLERNSITIVRGGQRSKTEGIDEIPFPTEFDGPQVPQNISLPVAASSTTTPAGDATFAPWPHNSTTPQSFEFRNAGDTFEVELTFGDGLKTVDLNLASESVRRVGIVKWGLSEDIYQPIFETQRCATQASNIVGQPMLLSTFSPPINTGVPGGNKVDRTWLLFVTVTKPE
jgi:hypothetical protein